MIVAQLVNSTTSRSIPTNAPAIFAGQCISRSNLPIINNTLPGNSVLGVAQSDLPAFVTGPQAGSPQYNSPRTINVATNGRLALRVFTGQFSAIAVGSAFGIYYGDVVTTGFTGAAAVTLNGDLLVVDEKVMGADGFGYVLVYFN